MLLDIVTKGTTDYSCKLKIVDATTGVPSTDLTFESAGIDLWYHRPGAVHTSITEATQTEDGAHSDGGFVHVSDGEYRLDLPDAALATGVDYVDVGGTITGEVVIGGRIRLTNVDLSDGVRAGLTALPNAAPDAAGGLVISDAGGVDIDAAVANIAAILADTGTDGVVLATTTINAIRDAIGDLVVESEGSYTVQQVLSIVLAYAAGEATGQDGTNPAFLTPNGNATRISAVTDGQGNRSAQTLTPSS